MQELLVAAIDKELWVRARKLAKKMIKIVRLAADPSTCKTGSPHVDGLYRIGWQRYQAAPQETKDMIDKLSKEIQECNLLARKKGKKKKKKK